MAGGSKKNLFGRIRWKGIRPALLLLLSAVIPIIVVAGAVGYYFIQTEKSALDGSMLAQAQRSAIAISKELETQIQLLTILSESPRLDPPLNSSQFARIAERLRLRVPSWDRLRVTDKDGSIILTVPEDASRPKVPLVDTASHQRLMEKAQPTIGDVIRGPGGDVAFPVRVPVIRKERTVYGLTAVIRPRAVTDVLRSSGVPSSWIGWVTDRDGKLVAASTGDPSLVGGEARKFAILHVSSAEPHLGALSSGTEIRVGSATVADTGWTVNIAMPLSEYHELSLRGYQILGAAISVSLLLSAAATFLFLREQESRRRDDAAVASWQRMDALGKLTGGVAHDFNNLLMVFQSGVESILRRREDERRVRQAADMMLEAVGRGKAMTQRLLSFSRRSNRDAETVSLQERVEPLQELLKKAAQDGVELEVDFPPNLWPVTVDAQGVDAALINLVTNAREAMTSGGRVSVRARNVDDLAFEIRKLRGPGIAIVVSDDGPGIGQEHLSRVFEPFFTTKGDTATGLGLTQVYSLADRSGGHVTVSSVESRGSAFTIYLPRANGPVSQVAQEPGPEALPRKVLVVDDTPSSLSVAKLALQDEKIEVIACSGGRDALSILSDHQDIELVLSDVMMPDIGGIELSEIVRKRHPTVGFVLMTGYSEAIEKGKEVGVPVVAKPFSQNELRAALIRGMAILGGTAVNVVPLRR